MQVPKMAVILILLASPAIAQISTTCSLYGNTAYCTSYDHGAVVQEQMRQQYETGQQVGSAIGMQIFYHHFPGWRRGYCSAHPGQPFLYGNADGDKITGICPSQDGLANEAATEWMAKHLKYKPTEANGKAMDAYIASNNLPRWEPKSYDKAYKALSKAGSIQ